VDRVEAIAFHVVGKRLEQPIPKRTRSWPGPHRSRAACAAPPSGSHSHRNRGTSALPDRFPSP
jgi:hypothetical protein